MPTTSTLLSQPFSRRRVVVLGALGTAAIVGLPSGVFAQNATPDAASITLAPFLDANAVHDISATFDQTAYDEMIQAYIDGDDKLWIEATVTINGSIYERVGMRLKGNSSLMGLRGQTGGMPGGRDGAGMGSVSADQPESLPWLIRMDEFVKDQNHQDIKQIVIRSNNSETSLNEAVALDLLQEAGLASQQAAAVRFQVNDGTPVLRLAIEHPKMPWVLAHFGEEGLLYKAEATGDYSYRGDNAEDYVDVFDIEAGDTGDDQADLTPLFGFLDFINNADDATFAAELDQRLNVDGFATYLAMMNLVRNTDDIDGPGNNSYLFVGPDGEYFTVAPWDMNLAFGGMGGFGGFGEGGPNAGEWPGVGESGTPEAMVPGEGDLPTFPDRGMIPGDGATPEAGFPDPGTQQEFPAGGGFGGRSNILVQRTAALTDFAALVTETQDRLAEALFTGSVAEGILTRRSDLLQAEASDLVAAETVASEAAAIRQQFTNP